MSFELGRVRWSAAFRRPRSNQINNHRPLHASISNEKKSRIFGSRFYFLRFLFFVCVCVFFFSYFGCVRFSFPLQPQLRFPFFFWFSIGNPVNRNSVKTRRRKKKKITRAETKQNKKRTSPVIIFFICCCCSLSRDREEPMNNQPKKKKNDHHRRKWDKLSIFVPV